MTALTLTRRGFAAAAALALSLGTAAAQPMQDRVHFLIPGGAGGGWDGAARGVGEALTGAGIVGNASFENMSGGGGGKAMVYLIDNARSNHGTLLVNSTPMIIRGLNGEVQQTFRDLTPIAAVLADYAALVVKKDSPIQSMAAFIEAFKADPNAIAVGGGSVPGGMDHLVASLVLEAAGLDPLAVKYIPYDAGGTAMAGLLSGEIQALSTGFSEAVELAKAGEIAILGVTAKQRVKGFEDIPTFAEQGYDMEFVNWRGFFGAPGLPAEDVARYEAMLKAMKSTPEWEAVRARNGWIDIHYSGADFLSFLEGQEGDMGKLMKDLGFM